MDTITLTKKLTMKKEYDVIVCGGGVAGVAAAVTVAKEGHSVLILEKSNILGGLATLGLINLFVPMCNGRGKQIIFGLCEKWVRLSAEVGFDTIPEEWKNGDPGKGAKTSVDDVRDIEDEAYLAPNEADCKVFILEDCDEYNVQSQNALLKIIEEPPANVKFVFTASSAGAILPTVRSRVCTLAADSRNVQDLLEQIKKEKASLSGSELESVGAFLQSYDKTDIKDLDEEQLLKYRLIAVDYFNGNDKQPVMKFPVKREELMVCLQAFMLASAEICRAKNSIKGVLSFLDKEQISACAAKTSVRKAHSVYDALEKGYILTQEYANINATISYLWQSIR